MRLRWKSLVIFMLRPVAWLTRGFERSACRAYRIAALRSAGADVPSTATILGSASLFGRGHCRVGERLLCYGDLFIETAADLEIGDDVVLARGVTLSAHAPLVLGDRVMVGEYTSIRTSAHRHGPDVCPRFAGDELAPVTIGDDVWIGRGVAVMPGITIGDGAVVGANSVVTSDVASGATVVGAPARSIDTRLRTVG